MKHSDSKQAEDLFNNLGKYIMEDFPLFSDITDHVRKSNSVRFFTGGVRINNGMYRTKEETDKYINDSLKMDLP